MRWKLYLNIRQKVIFGLTLGIMAVALVGGLSFRYLKEIESKQHLVEVADDLNNVILEIRRYEKNYLLYGSDQDFTENRLFIEKGLSTIDSIFIKGEPESSAAQSADRAQNASAAQQAETRQGCTHRQKKIGLRFECDRMAFHEDRQQDGDDRHAGHHAKGAHAAHEPGCDTKIPGRHAAHDNAHVGG